MLDNNDLTQELEDHCEQQEFLDFITDLNELAVHMYLSEPQISIEFTCLSQDALSDKNLIEKYDFRKYLK